MSENEKNEAAAGQPMGWDWARRKAYNRSLKAIKDDQAPEPVLEGTSIRLGSVLAWALVDVLKETQTSVAGALGMTPQAIQQRRSKVKVAFLDLDALDALDALTEVDVVWTTEVLPLLVTKVCTLSSRTDVGVPVSTGEVSAPVFLKEDIYEAPPLVEGMLPGEGLAVLAAPPKAGKSFLALAIAQAVATGGMLFGMFPTTQSRVTLINTELSPRQLQRRLRDVIGMRSAPDALGIVNQRDGAVEAAHEALAGGSKMVIVDLFEVAPASPVKQAQRLGELQDTARAHHALLLLVMHTTKDGKSVLGGVKVPGTADVLLELARDKEDRTLATLAMPVHRTMDVPAIPLRWRYPRFVPPDAEANEAPRSLTDFYSRVQTRVDRN